MTRPSRFFLPVLVTLTILLHLYVAVSPDNSLVNWFTTDDAYYYFKVAQNVSEGRGFTFDGINSASGFHPLWMAVCIPVFFLARFNLTLPLRILVILAGIFNAASGVLLYKTLRRVLTLPVSMFFSVFWAFSSLVQTNVSQLGMETSINAFSLILLMYLLVTMESAPFPNSKEQLRWQWKLGGAALLAVFSRLDNIFLVMIVLLWLIYRHQEKRSLIVFSVVLSIESVFLSYILRTGFREAYLQYLPSIYLMLGSSLIIKLLFFAAGGLFDQTDQKSLPDILRTSAIVTLASLTLSGLMMAAYAAALFDRFPRSVLFYDWGITLAGMLPARGLWLRYRSKDQPDQKRTVIQQLKLHVTAWLQNGRVYIVSAAGLLSLYMLGHKWLFGSFSPVSGQIKHWWGTIYTVYGRPVNSMAAFWGYNENFNHSPWFLAFKGWFGMYELLHLQDWIRPEALPSVISQLTGILLVLFIIIIFLRKKEAGRCFQALVFLPLLAGAVLQMTQYFGTGYANARNWYWVQQMLVIVWLAAIFTDLWYRQLLQWKIPRQVPETIMAILALVWAGNYAGQVFHMVPAAVSQENKSSYLGGVQLLEAKTEPGAIIGSTGGGVIAYFIQDRTIVNLDGLMNSQQYFKAMQQGTATEFLTNMGLDYVYGNRYMVTKSDPFKDIFAGHLKELDTFAGSTLFRFVP